ncbi:glutathione S-transferase family protein [Erythrobacter sp.]|uniref:glutathione S-transferase family protein n=1 Tax=Erythrobacter sp. TaxID=1042 RepID=UPI002EAA43C1|nr:glutathione S-transferase family protein [Erythrobacter sp.]
MPEAAQVRIVGTVVSTYTRIVEITCEEAGLTHEIIPTPANSPQNRHPFGKVPVVEVDGLELIESGAIAHYLDSTHNAAALQPREPASRATADTWIAIGNNYLFLLFERGLVMPYVMHRHGGFPLDVQSINRALPDIGRALGFLEAELQRDGAWTACGFTLADVFLYPIIRSLQMTPQGAAGIAQCDALAAWLTLCEKRPSIRASRWESEK